jgi:hypothetical protein
MISPRSAEGPARAAAARNRLVVHGRDGQVVVVDATNGEIVWKIKGQGTRGQDPSIGGTTVYLGGLSLMARRLEQGDFLWEEETLASGDSTVGWGSPAADGDSVVAVDGYEAHRFSTLAKSRHPSTEWMEPLDNRGTGISAPAVAGSTVWVPESDNGLIRVVHKATGRRLFPVKMQREGTYRLASNAHRVFVTRGGRIMAMPVFGE